MKKVVTFGEVMLRLGAPDYQRFSQVNSFDVSIASSEANVVVSLANYGITTEFVSRFPDNPIGERCLMDLSSHHVGLNHVLIGGNRLGVLYLEKGAVVRSSKVIYDRVGSSFATIRPGMIDWKEVLKDADWFHWTGITPALSQSAADACMEAIQLANDMGVTVSCDLNYRGNLWKYGKKASVIMTPMVASSDIILGNEEDCDKVFGIKPEEFDISMSQGQIDQKLYESVCKQMIVMFPRCEKMVVTLRGSINANHNTWSGVLYSDGILKVAKKYDITHIVDRVGSGDAFMGALIYGLINNSYDDQDALDFAVAASSLKHSIQGDYNLVSIQEVISILHGSFHGRIER